MVSQLCTGSWVTCQPRNACAEGKRSSPAAGLHSKTWKECTWELRTEQDGLNHAEMYLLGTKITCIQQSCWFLVFIHVAWCFALMIYCISAKKWLVQPEIWVWTKWNFQILLPHHLGALCSLNKGAAAWAMPTRRVSAAAEKCWPTRRILCEYWAWKDAENGCVPTFTQIP